MKTQLHVMNMKCQGCVNTVKTGLSSFPEVNSVEVDLTKALVDIDYNEPLTLEKIKERLKQIGYPEKQN